MSVLGKMSRLELVSMGAFFNHFFLFSIFCLKKLLQLWASLIVKNGSGVIFFDPFFCVINFA